MTPELALAFAFALPLAGSFIGLALDGFDLFRSIARGVLSVLTTLMCLLVLQACIAGETPSLVLLQLAPGLDLALAPDVFGASFGLIASFTWTMTEVFSISYFNRRRDTGVTTYSLLSSLSMAACLGLAYSGDLITLVVFHELMTFLVLALLVARRDVETRGAARLFAGLTLGASYLGLFPAAVLAVSATGEAGIQAPGQLGDHTTLEGVNLLLVLFVLGIAKAGIFPFHGWLPRASNGPSPIAALLAGPLAGASGAYALTRILGFEFGARALEEASFREPLMWLAALGALGLSIAALGADRLSLRCARACCAHLGLIVLMALAGGPHVVVSGTLLVGGYCLAASGLYLALGGMEVQGPPLAAKSLRAGAIPLAAGGQLPAWAFALSGLALTGVPPFAAAWGSVATGAALAAQGHYLLVFIGALATCLSAFAILAPATDILFVGRRPNTQTRPLRPGEWLGNAMLAVPSILASLAGGALFLASGVFGSGLGTGG